MYIYVYMCVCVYPIGFATWLFLSTLEKSLRVGGIANQVLNLVQGASLPHRLPSPIRLHQLFFSFVASRVCGVKGSLMLVIVSLTFFFFLFLLSPFAIYGVVSNWKCACINPCRFSRPVCWSLVGLLFRKKLPCWGNLTLLLLGLDRQASPLEIIGPRRRALELKRKLLLLQPVTLSVNRFDFFH